MAEYSTVLGFKVDLAPLSNLENQLEKTQTELKQTSTGFKEAAKDADKFTMSAKAQAAAMRGVPAQLTDIAVSLQGGQNPLTVLLQQGGQLKDMFGGVVPAVQALGTSIMGLVNPVTVSIAAIAGLGYVIYKLGEDGRQADENIHAIATTIGDFANSGAFRESEAQIRNFVEILSDLKNVKAGDLASALNGLDFDTLSAPTGELAVNIAKIADGSEEINKKYQDMYNNMLKNVSASADLLYSTGYITQEERDQLKTMESLGMLEEARAKIRESQVKHAEDEAFFADLYDKTLRTTYDVEQKIEANRQRIVELQNRGGEASFQMANNIQRENDKLLVQLGLLQQRNALNQGTVDTSAANQAAARMEALEKQRDDVRARYGTLSQQREIAIARSTEKYRLQLSVATNDAERKLIQEAQADELKGINKNFDDRDKRANRSAESAARKAENEAKRLARQYENIVKKFSDQVNDIRNQGMMDQTSSSLFADSGFQQGNSLQRQFEAQAQAAARMGATIESAKVSANGLGIELSFNLDKFAEANKLTQAQKEALEAQVQTAVQAADANERGKIIDEARAKLAIEKRDGDRYLADIAAENEIRANNLWARETDINRLIKDSAFQRQLQAQYEENLAKYGEEYAQKIRDQNAALYEQIATQEVISERIAEQRDLSESFKTNIVDTIGKAFDQMWEGQSVNFGDLLLDLSKQLAKSMLFNYLMQGLSGGGWSLNVGTTTFAANGGVFDKGVKKFANGGIVNRATPFGMANGGLGVMGEAGPEAILPLTRGANGKLGVQMEGGSGVNVVIGAGAVVVNATNDSKSDTEATAQAIKTLIDTRVNQIIKDSMRTGNILNRSRSGIY